MLTRRDWLKRSAAASALLSTPLARLLAQPEPTLLTRAIPATGEALPIIGLGSSATFSRVARSEDIRAVRSVLQALLDHGGRVFDTAPGYGASEEVAGQVVDELGVAAQIFWATKVNVAGWGGGKADPAAARAQIERSFSRIDKPKIDLIQVHNLGDVPTQLAILKELKAQGRIRYLGVTTTNDRRYDEIAEIMQREPLDFIGIDYAIDNRTSADRVLPLAEDRGIAVLNYSPFGRYRLWSRVRGREVPEWAAEFGATSWAQFFLKYVAANPAVTCVTPSTSRPENMIDNLGAAVGPLPDETHRRRMVEVVDALPS